MNLFKKVQFFCAAKALFKQLDLRAGLILSCDTIENSDKLYKLNVDLGQGQQRQICTGLRNFISQEQMMGFVTIIANIKPIKLRGEISHGMVLVAKNQDELSLIRPSKDSAAGDRYFIDEFETKDILQIKSKVWDEAVKLLKTDSQGKLIFGGYQVQTVQGSITSNIPNGEVS